MASWPHAHPHRDLGPTHTTPLPRAHLYIGRWLGFHSFLFSIRSCGAGIPPLHPLSHPMGDVPRRSSTAPSSHTRDWCDSIFAEVCAAGLIDVPPSPPSIVANENHHRAALRRRQHHTTCAWCNSTRAYAASMPPAAWSSLLGVVEKWIRDIAATENHHYVEQTARRYGWLSMATVRLRWCRATGTRLWPCRRRDDTDERPPPPVPNLCCAWIGPPLPRREYPPTLPVPKVITDCLECFCGARDWLQDRLSGVITDYM
jgi:hypothetical protein